MKDLDDARFEISPLDLLASLWRGRLILLGALVPGLATSLLLWLLLPREYTATSVVMPVADESYSLATGLADFSDALGANVLGSLGLAVPSESNQLALSLLASESFLLSFVESNKIRETLFANQIAEAEPGDDLPTLNDTVRVFREEILAVNEDTELGTVSISVTFEDRELAANWTNALTDSLDRFFREKAIREAKISQEYIDRELPRTSKLATQQTLNKLREAELAKSVIAGTRDSYRFWVVQKAIAPDEDDYTSPNPLVVITVPSFLFVGCVGLVILGRSRPVVRRANDA